MKAAVRDAVDRLEGDPAKGPLERPALPLPGAAALPAKAVGDEHENSRVAIVGEIAYRDERVLQVRTADVVRVHVTGRDRPNTQSLGEALSCAVAELVAASVGALQLHPQALRAERVEQASGGWLVFDAVFRAARQAHQSLCMLQDLLQGNGWLAGTAISRISRARVRARQQSAEVAPAPGVADQQRHVPVGFALRTGRGLDGDLRAEARTHRRVQRVHRELHRPRERIVIGQRQRGVPEGPRSFE